MPALTLALLEETYAICRFPAGTRAAMPSPGPFSLLVQAVEETTLVCPLGHAPAEAEIDAGWRCFRIAQSFDFAVPGILAVRCSSSRASWQCHGTSPRSSCPQPITCRMKAAGCGR